MHVMVATDGSLDPEPTARLAAGLAGSDGQVTVFTAVEVPRRLLADMRDAALPHTEKLSEVSVEYRHDQAGDDSPIHWVGDDAVIAQYVGSRVQDRTASLVAALSDLGVEADVVGEEGENAARAILSAAKEHGVDVLCIGPTGHGRFEGSLGAISTKLARRADCSVLIIR